MRGGVCVCVCVCVCECVCAFVEFNNSHKLGLVSKKSIHLMLKCLQANVFDKHSIQHRNGSREQRSSRSGTNSCLSEIECTGNL